MRALALMLFLTGILIAAATPAAEVEAPGAVRLKLTDPRLSIHGLPWFREDRPALQRLPERLKSTFREGIWTNALCPSGGRIRFRTDSTTVDLRATVTAVSMNHMPLTGSAGHDIYVNGIYMGTAVPDSAGKVVNLRRKGPWLVGRTREMREVTIYMPLYSPTAIEEIILDAGAKVEAASPLPLAKPIVYYGSSITMGGCAANPGLSYPAMLGRWLNADFVNLGFSGNGLGDESVARAMTEIDASCIVLDYWANPDHAVLGGTLPGFVDILRQKLPTVPILITGPYYEPANDLFEHAATSFTEKQRVVREFVEKRRQAGDANIHLVDGLELISKEQSYGLVDGRHCNTLGFYFFAKGLEPHLRKALNLPAGDVAHH